MAYTKHMNLPEMPVGPVDWPALFNAVVTAVEAGRTLKLTAGEAITQYKGFTVDTSGEAAIAVDSKDIRGLWQSVSTDEDADGYGQLDGTMTNNAWSWTPGDFLYCDASGDLTDTAPAADSKKVAKALSATEIMLLAEFDVPGGGSDNYTVQADAGDASPGYLDAKVMASIVVDATDKIKLDGDSASPGNTKAYSTNGAGVKGWYDFPTGSDVYVKADSGDSSSGYLSAKVQKSITVNLTDHKMELSGDSASPGNLYYYGTNSGGTKGWYALTMTDTYKVMADSGDATPGYLDAKVMGSIVIDATDKLKLSGDATSPGVNKYYGTDSGGTKGFFSISSGTWTDNTTYLCPSNQDTGSTVAQMRIMDDDGYMGYPDSMPTLQEWHKSASWIKITCEYDKPASARTNGELDPVMSIWLTGRGDAGGTKWVGNIAYLATVRDIESISTGSQGVLYGYATIFRPRFSRGHLYGQKDDMVGYFVQNDADVGYQYRNGDSSSRAVWYGSPVKYYACHKTHVSSGAILPTNTTYWHEIQQPSVPPETTAVAWSSSSVTYCGTDNNATEGIYFGHNPAFGEKYEFATGISINSNCEWAIRIGGNDADGYRRFGTGIKISGVVDAGIDMAEALNMESFALRIPHSSSIQSVIASGNASAVLMYLDDSNALQVGSGNCATVNLSSGVHTAWSALTTYKLYDCCSSGGVNYRCILEHTNQVPPNITYWEDLSNPVYLMVGGAVKNVTIDGSGFLKGV